MDGKTIAMAATDGFRLALDKTEVAIPLEKKQDGRLLVVKVKDLEAGAKYF